jgi:hypothetical protein
MIPTLNIIQGRVYSQAIHSLDMGVKLLMSIDISTRAPWITLNDQHIMACTSTKNCTGMQDSS